MGSPLHLFCGGPSGLCIWTALRCTALLQASDLPAQSTLQGMCLCSHALDPTCSAPSSATQANTQRENLPVRVHNPHLVCCGPRRSCMRLALRCTTISCPLWRTALTARRSSAGRGLMGTPRSASSDVSLIPVRSLIWRSLKLKVSKSLPWLLPLTLQSVMQFDTMLQLDG